MEQYYNMAMKVAKRSSHTKHKLGAVVVRGGAIMSFAFNIEGCSVPSNLDFVRRGKHAEKRALKSHVDYSGSYIFVVRSNNRLSKPCDDCMKVIKKSGITKIFYINDLGNYVCERVK